MVPAHSSSSSLLSSSSPPARQRSSLLDRFCAASAARHSYDTILGTYKDTKHRYCTIHPPGASKHEHPVHCMLLHAIIAITLRYKAGQAMPLSLSCALETTTPASVLHYFSSVLELGASNLNAHLDDILKKMV